MPRRVELDLLLTGLALARNWLVGDPATVERILTEARRVVGGASDDWFDAPERTANEGYGDWSATYDLPGNPVLDLEAPVVRELVAGVAPGVAVDAACGTGRHTAELRDLGNRTIGVDASPAMLARARARVPEADLREGDLCALPVETTTADLALCALALTHLADLDAGVRELARVTRPGGRVVISDVHPSWVMLGSQALYREERGEAAWVRNHVHGVSAYLHAFRAAGLEVRSCHELPCGRPAVERLAARVDISTEVVAEAIEGFPAVIVWELDRPA